MTYPNIAGRSPPEVATIIPGRQSDDMGRPDSNSVDLLREGRQRPLQLGVE